jgi:hypothetical protein
MKTGPVKRCSEDEAVCVQYSKWLWQMLHWWNKQTFRTFIVSILLCVYSVRIQVSHHNKIKQDRNYCIYIHFIISIIHNMFRLLLSHLQVFCISSISYCSQYEFILCSLIIYIHKKST